MTFEEYLDFLEEYRSLFGLDKVPVERGHGEYRDTRL